MFALKPYTRDSKNSVKTLLPPIRIELSFQSDSLLTELTWQVLVKGYLTSPFVETSGNLANSNNA